MGSETTELLFQIGGAIGLSSILTVLIKGVIDRRKLGAEATSILTQAASGLVTTIRGENTILSAELAKVQNQMKVRDAADKVRDRRQDALRKAIEVHHAYDVTLADKVRQAGLLVEDPPPLPDDIPIPEVN